MQFVFKTVIKRSRKDVFVFFRDVDRHAGRKDSIVPVLDKITPGPVRLGTRYYEVVRIMPFVAGKVFTEILGLVPDQRLTYRYVALGMKGELTYQFNVTSEGTEVEQHQSLVPGGMLKLFAPIIGAMFSRMATRRLSGIKHLLESEGGRDQP
jgi:hypothetical protein